MNRRQWEAIEDRLLSPCPTALEAYERLQAAGEPAAAEAVMAAMQRFVDDLRVIRFGLRDRLPARMESS